MAAGALPYCVVGPCLGPDFALGVVRTYFYCYKRLLALNWAANAEAEAEAAEGGGDDSSDSDTELASAARERVPPSVWLLAVTEREGGG